MRVIGPQVAGQPTEQIKNSQPSSRSRWLPIVLAALIFLAAWLVGLTRGPLTLDIGGDDRQDLIYLRTAEGGFFAPEKQPGPAPSPGYDNSYRWTGRIAYINLPWPLDAVPLKATLRASAQRPDRAPDQPGTTLAISAVTGNNATDLGKYPVLGLYEGSDLSFQIPVHLRPAVDRLKLKFESSETYQPGKGDVRNLSAVFFSLKLEPDYAAFGWKGWLASLARPALLALLALGSWGLAGFFTRRQFGRLVAEAIAGLLMLASLVGWPLAAEPFYTPWLLLLAGTWLLLWLAGRFAEAAPGLPAPFVYAATLLPIMPVAQLIADRQDLTSFNPGSVALPLYLGALFISVATYFASRRNFEAVFSWVFLGVAVLLFAYTHWRVYDQNLYRGGDFRNYYIALLDMEEFKQPLYSLQQMAELPGQAIRMPPAFGLLFWPFVRLFGRDVNGAIFAWRVANELLLIPTLFFFWQTYRKLLPDFKLMPAILFVVLSFGQLYETTAYGQLNYVLLFGLALTGMWVQQRRDALAGLALSLPIWAKLIPVISGAFFVLRGRWRGLVDLVGGAVLMNLLTIGAVGWDNFWFYFTRGMWAVNEPELGITNQSWWGFMGRLGVTEVVGDFRGGFPTYLSPLGYLVALVGLLLTLFMIYDLRFTIYDLPRRGALWGRFLIKARNLQPAIRDLTASTGNSQLATGNWQLANQLALGALTLVALWIPPFSWMHYIVPGLVAIVAMLVTLAGKREAKGSLAVFAVAYVLLAYGGRSEFFFGEAVGLARLGSSYRFLATFALWALNLYLIWRFSSKTPPVES